MDNIEIINTNNNINQNNFHTTQENTTINNYNEKKTKIKNCYDIIYERYQQSQEFYELFINLIKDYKEVKNKNIENLNNLLRKYFPEDDKQYKKVDNLQINTIKSEFKEIIKNQINAETDEINQLNFDNKIKNISLDDINKSKKLLDNLKDLYNSYINSINNIEKKHMKYLKYFNEYENKLIDFVDKNIKSNGYNNNNNNNNNNSNKKEKNHEIITTNEEENKNDININDFIYDEKDLNEINVMTKKLVKKEKKYRKILKEYDEQIHPKYLEFKKCIDDLSIYHNVFNEQENQIFTFVYLGYVISIESQHSYQKKELNFENLTAINYQNYNELNELFESITFEKYNMTLISSNKEDNHLCKQIPPEVIIKLSNLMNSYFPYIPKLEDGDYEEPNNRLIKTFIRKIFNEDGVVSENEENNLNIILKESQYRFLFLKTLNYKRIEGIFLLSGKHMILLGNAIRTITDLYDIKTDDFEVLKLLIIMCQTYYTLNNEKTKIYLIRFIEDHSLFRSGDIWEYYIDESIRREIIEKEKNDKAEDDLVLDEETKNFKLCNIYFSVILSVTQNILEFQIDKDIIKTIIINVINQKYNQINLIPVYIEQIISLIDETIYQKRKKFNIDVDILGKN